MFLSSISFYSPSSLDLPVLLDRLLFWAVMIAVRVFVNLIRSGISFYSPSSLDLPVLLDRLLFWAVMIAVIVFINLIRSGIWTPCIP